MLETTRKAKLKAKAIQVRHLQWDLADKGREATPVTSRESVEEPTELL